MTNALQWYWMVRGQIREAWHWTETALLTDREADSDARARAWSALAGFQLLQGDVSAVSATVDSLQREMRGCRAKTRWLGWALLFRAFCTTNHFTRARLRSFAATQLLRRSDVTWERANAWAVRGEVERLINAARVAKRESLNARRGRDRWTGLFEWRLRRNVARALKFHTESHRGFEADGDAFQLGLEELNLGALHVELGDISEGIQWLLRAVDQANKTGNDLVVGTVLIVLACALAQTGETTTAALLLGAGNHCLAEQRAELQPAEQKMVEKIEAGLVGQFGEAQFRALFERGTALSVADALSYVPQGVAA